MTQRNSLKKIFQNHESIGILDLTLNDIESDNSKALPSSEILYEQLLYLQNQLEVERKSHEITQTRLENAENENFRLKLSHQNNQKSLRRVSIVSVVERSRKPSILRRESISAALSLKNSMGYSLEDEADDDDENENEIVEENISHLLARITSPISFKTLLDSQFIKENNFYLEMIECLTSVLHYKKTLKNEITYESDIISKIFIDTIHYISGLFHESIEIDKLVYPIKWLIKNFPDHIERDDGRGWLPLHWYLAISDYPQSDYIEMLYELVGPESFSQTVSPLSIAVSKPFPNIEIIKLLLKLQPDAASIQDIDGSFPIMHAATTNIHSNIVELLYENNSKAINISDNFECYTIHYACYSGYLPTVVYLLNKSKDFIKLKSGNNSLPLHEAVQNHNDGLNIATLLYNTYPEAISSKDQNGAIPIHLAAKFGNLDILKYIYNLFPRGSTIKDSEGLLPIHYAAERTFLKTEIVNFLVEVTNNNENII